MENQEEGVQLDVFCFRGLDLESPGITVTPAGVFESNARTCMML